MSETDIQAEILFACGSLPGVRLFRNTVGNGWVGKVVRNDGHYVLLERPRAVTFGLTPGSPDLVGWRSVVVTQDMVGQTIAQFVGLEVKTATGAVRKNQDRFRDALLSSGAVAEVVRSVDLAKKLFVKE